MNTDPKDRREILSEPHTPQRSQDPAEVRELARELLSNASFASSLFDPATAASLTRLRPDVELWRYDEKVGRAIYSHSAAARLTVKRSILAPLVRRAARIRMRALEVEVASRSREASEQRIATIEETPNFLDWASGGTWDQTPIEAAFSRELAGAVLLTPDQFRGCGVVELVRASGQVLGRCDGDNLVNAFLRLIIDLGTDSKLETLSVGDDFYDFANDPKAELLPPLSGPQRMLALTILSAWIRMSRLGVRLSGLDRLRRWGDFFDGRQYGAPAELVGESWKLSDIESQLTVTRMDLSGPLKDGIPWIEQSGGVPLIVVGIAAELFRQAINRCGILDQVSPGFALPEGDPPKASGASIDPSSDRIIVQLRERHGFWVSQPIGCCRRVLLAEKLAVRRG